MHYALYRKYRPLTFSDVVGQDHITTTLKNQVRDSQLSHAYLFCGTRGTGKTSCAKILARAVNCLSPVNGEPCNECEVCSGILDGTIFDVMEIDAASNNGVENIRQIRDEILYTPVKAGYKVYIIDEVHMLSTGAFNALLKTLEEPPPHVLFILATTEAHKIPATILSRCQRFDFRRLSVKTLSEQIRKILEAENKSADDKTVRLVATLADGSVRDALSILEKVSESESYEEAEALLGVIGRSKLYGIAESMADKDTDTLYRFVDELYFSSKDLSIMITELTSVFRDLLAVKSAVSTESFLDKSEEDLKQLKSLAKKYSYEHIVYAMDTLFEASVSFAKSPDKRAAAELCLVKIARPVLSENEKGFTARLGQLETRLDNLEKEGIKVSKETLTSYAPPAEVKPQAPAVTEAVKVPEKKAEPPKAPEVISQPQPPKEETEDFPVPPPPEEVMPPDPYEEYEDFFAEEIAEILEDEPSVPQPAKQEEVKRESKDLWQELLTLKDIAQAIREKDMTLGAILANYTRAVYNSNQIIILCKEDKDMAELKTPQALATIKEAFDKNRREGYEIRILKGDVNDYITKNKTYDTIENNELFDFN